MQIVFSNHAEDKFHILRGHGFHVSRDMVIRTIEDPEKREGARNGRWIVQGTVDASHVIRVVCEQREGRIVVVTFYPGRRKYYEGQI